MALTALEQAFKQAFKRARFAAHALGLPAIEVLVAHSNHREAREAWRAFVDGDVRQIGGDVHRLAARRVGVGRTALAAAASLAKLLEEELATRVHRDLAGEEVRIVFDKKNGAHMLERWVSAAGGRPAPAPLTIGTDRVLVAIAERPAGVSRSRLPLLTGFKRRTCNDYVARLIREGRVFTTGTSLFITAKARDELGPTFKELPKGPALVAYWLEKLPMGEATLLNAILASPNGAAERRELVAATGFAPRTVNDYAARLIKRQLVVKDGRHRVAALPELVGKGGT
jgi:hypothetical protein